MSNILNALKNPYVFGVIVFVLTWPLNNWFAKKANKSEYYKRVDNANSNIVELLTDCIISSKVKVIDKALVDEITHAVSVELNVDIKDLYKINQIRSLLVKIIVNIKLMPQEQKKEMIEMITSMLIDDEISKDMEENITFTPVYSKLKLETTILTTVMTSIIALISVIIIIISGKMNLFNLNINYDINIFITMILAVFFIQALFILFLKIKRRERRRERQKHIEKYYEEEESISD